MLRSVAVTLAMVVLLPGRTTVHGQATFDAAVVKRSDPRAVSPVVPGVPLPGGRWSAERATLATILRSVYGVPPDRIIGLPAWAKTERYDISAKAQDNASQSALQDMARALVVERFGLRARIDKRDGAVYAIVRRDPATLGPGMRQVACDSNRLPRSGQAPEKKAEHPCGTETLGRIDGGAWRLRLRGRTLADLLTLSGARTEFDLAVVDKTGLGGTFDIDFEFRPRSLQAGPATAYPRFEIALEEQLGLRLERRIEIMDVLIVDAVERPVLD